MNLFIVRRITQWNISVKAVQTYNDSPYDYVPRDYYIVEQFELENLFDTLESKVFEILDFDNPSYEG